MATNVGFDFNLSDLGFLNKGGGIDTPRDGDMIGIDIDIDIDGLVGNSFGGYRSSDGGSTSTESDTDDFANFDWKMSSGSGYPKDCDNFGLGEDMLMDNNVFVSSLAASLQKKRRKPYVVQTISKPVHIQMLNNVAEKKKEADEGEQKAVRPSPSPQKKHTETIKVEERFTSASSAPAQLTIPTRKFAVGTKDPSKKRAKSGKPKRKRGVPLTAEEKKERATRRRIANREAANRSRMRKRNHLEKVEEENRKLRERIRCLEMEKDEERRERERMEQEIAHLQKALGQVNVSDELPEMSGMPDLSRVGDMPAPSNDDGDITMRTLPTISFYRSSSRDKLSSYNSMLTPSLRSRAHSTSAQLTRARINKIPLLHSTEKGKTKEPALVARANEKKSWLNAVTFKALQLALLCFGLLLVLGMSGTGLGSTGKSMTGLRHQNKANFNPPTMGEANLFTPQVGQIVMPSPR